MCDSANIKNINKKKGNEYRCPVPSCGNTPKNSNLTFFSFPKDTKRLRLWATACSQEALLNKKTCLYKNYRVCSRHFDDNMFMNSMKNRLYPHAAPIRFLDETPTVPVGIKVEACDMSDMKAPPIHPNYMPVLPTATTTSTPMVLAPPTNPYVYQFFQLQLPPSAPVAVQPPPEPVIAPPAPMYADKSCQSFTMFESNLPGRKMYINKIKKLCKQSNLLALELKHTYSLCERYLSPEIIRFIKTEAKSLSAASEISDRMLECEELA